MRPRSKLRHHHDDPTPEEREWIIAIGHWVTCGAARFSWGCEPGPTTTEIEIGDGYVLVRTTLEGAFSDRNVPYSCSVNLAPAVWQRAESLSDMKTRLLLYLESRRSELNDWVLEWMALGCLLPDEP